VEMPSFVDSGGCFCSVFILELPSRLLRLGFRVSSFKQNSGFNEMHGELQAFAQDGAIPSS